ncbi:MAG: Ni/Fe hydrogenase subunit alpha [Candidatus Hermodarchaeia archaeon]|jgi:coenzyme F420-reducing hydrogenase alpha subunit
MSSKKKTVTIAPVSRVEGHGAITINLDEKGNVAKAHFSVMDVRGYEKFMQNRPVEEANRIATRMCGICPVSHHLASSKAADALYAVNPPRTAKLLRELMHQNQMLHSHVLHFFYLAAPDLLIPDGDPSTRHVVTLLKQNPDLVKKVIRLRQIGQDGIKVTGGRSIHPVTSQAGGISKPLSEEERDEMLNWNEEAYNLFHELYPVVQPLLGQVEVLDELKTGYVGLVNNGNLEFYDGPVRIVSSEGKRLAEFPIKDYLNHIGEHVEDYSYLKFPFYLPQGWPKGIYRVGPLARLNVADKIATPEANDELTTFRAQFGNTPDHTFLYHYARMIEILYAVERTKELLNDPDITNTDIMTNITIKGGRGVGVLEAPRGLLIHDYTANPNGILTNINLIVSTVGNNPAMDQGVETMAKRLIKNGHIDQKITNHVEMLVRSYDPCLSCAVHAVNGQMAMRIKVLNHIGETTQIIQNFED